MAFICSHLPQPILFPPPPPPTHGRAALGHHSPSPRVCRRGRAGGSTHQIFSASWVYQKFLPMVLRWRASCAGASLIQRFHMTSRQPYWCSKTKKRRPYWCTKPFRTFRTERNALPQNSADLFTQVKLWFCLSVRVVRCVWVCWEGNITFSIPLGDYQR